MSHYVRLMLVVASQTFRDARRNKIFYATFAFALLVVANATLFTEVTITELDRILVDAGFAVISVFALLLTVFVGVGIINREIDRKSSYVVVSRSLPRSAYIVGKYLGLLAIVWFATAVLLLVFVAVMVAYKAPVSATLLWAYMGLLGETAVVGAFAVLCSCVASSVVSAFASGVMLVGGHLVENMHAWTSRGAASALSRTLGNVVYYTLPNLERLSFKTELTYQLPVYGLAPALLYAMTYVAFFMAIAVVAFSRRDFR